MSSAERCCSGRLADVGDEPAQVLAALGVDERVGAAGGQLDRARSGGAGARRRWSMQRLWATR